MKKFIWVIIAAIVISLSLFIFKPNEKLQSLKVTSGNVKPSALPTPSPSPKVIIDSSSDLKIELQKLTPEDFSGDYKELSSSL